MDFTDRDSGHVDVGYSDGIHLMQMARIIWAATSGTRSRLFLSLALLETRQTLTQDLHSPIPPALKIPNKEQEARHENPHAPEDEQDHTKVVFAKANVIHNDRILLGVDESRIRIRSIAGLLKPDTTIGELPYN
jgi:hypothetical protein